MTVARSLRLAALLLMPPRLASAEVLPLRCGMPWICLGEVVHRPMMLDNGVRLVRDGRRTS